MLLILVHVCSCDVPTITIGALGAGKTTLIRHILHEPHGYRVAVILNEVGDEQGLEQSMVLPLTVCGVE